MNHHAATTTDRAVRPGEEARPLAPLPRTVIDPCVEAVSWRAWRVTGASPHAVSSDVTYRAVRAAMSRMVEQLALPGRTSLIVQASVRPDRPGSVDLDFAVGVMGERDTVDSETEVVEHSIDSMLVPGWMPYSVERVAPEAVLSTPRRAVTALLRRSMTTFDDGDGGELFAVPRSAEVLEPWSRVLALLHRWNRPVTVRVTMLPTEFTALDRAQIARMADRVSVLRENSRYRTELNGIADRLQETLADTSAALDGVVCCGEIAVISDRTLPERLLRAVATAFAGTSDTPRWAGPPMSAPFTGGLEVVSRPDGHRDALNSGVPLHGGLIRHDLRDLWALRDAPLRLPVPVNEPLPGISVGVRRHRPVPDGLDHGVLLGHSHGGVEVRLPESELRRHMSITGVTGCGKTSLMMALGRADLLMRRAVLWIDPHGSGADMLVADARAVGRRVVLFAAGDRRSSALQFAPRLRRDGRNLVEVQTAVRRIVNAVISHLPTEWSGPRFSMTATALLMVASAHGLSIARIVELAAVESECRKLAEHEGLPAWVCDQLVGQFSRGNQDSVGVREWVVSKFAPFFTGPAQALLAPAGKGVDVGRELLAGGMVIVNLAGLPPQDAALFGHVVLELVSAAIIERGAVPPDEPAIRLYVDEAHLFPCTSLEQLITGGRKFGAALIAACQSISQYDGNLHDLVLGASTQVAFAQTPLGAARLAPVMNMPIGDLLDQPDHHAYVRAGQRPAASVDTPRYESVPPAGQLMLPTIVV